MKKRGRNKGFTIVELIIVIIVVAILATMIALSYNNAQIQSRDTAIRDAADKLADTIKVMQVRQGSFPAGGSGSTVAVSSSTGCANGNGGFVSPSYSGVQCTIGDAAVAMGYLQPVFFTNLPPNTRYGNTYAQVFTVYQCGTNYYLFYALEMPTSAETSSYNTVATGPCSTIKSTLDTYGMKAVKNLSSI